MIIDFSTTIYDKIPSYPGNPEVTVKNTDCMAEAGFYVTNISMSVHTATHVDTPLHCINGKPSTENIDLTHYIGKAYCVDVPTNKKETIKFPSDFDFNKLKGNDIIIFRTGWENKMGTDEYFDLWPYIDEELALKLVDLKIKTVGLDTPSVDSLETNNLTHKILFSNNICVIESLVNLDKVKNKSFFFSAAPLKIKNGEGSPVRAYGIID